MADLTRLQIADLVKATIDDKDKIEPIWLAQQIAYSQRMVQIRMMDLGLKQFTKTDYLFANGGYTACPTDMIPQPNAIIDLRVATWASTTIPGNPLAIRATGDLTLGTKTLTITAIEPGEKGNEVVVNIIADADIPTPFTPVLTTEVDIDGVKHFTIAIKSGSTTIEQLLEFFLAEPFLTLNYLATKAPADAGAITLTAPAEVQLDSGTGSGWLPAREYSIEDWSRLEHNTFRIPTSTWIVYKRVGDAFGRQYLFFLPPNVTFIEITYYYLIADMANDATLSGLGVFEELLIIDVTAKCYEKLRLLTSIPAKQAEYQRKANELRQSYIDLFDSRIKDKERLLSEKPRD